MPVVLVKDLWPDALRIFGTSDASTVFRYLNDTVKLLADAGTWTPMNGYVDVCATGRCVSLPTEVETPLQVNINGVPVVGRDALFEFHVNGPGDRWKSCKWSWMDGGLNPTFKDITKPSQLVAYLDKEEDAGKELWVYGQDDKGVELRTKKPDGSWVDGILVPTIYGYPMPDPTAPLVRRITRVRKAPMVGRSRLATRDFSGDPYNQGNLLGVYQWNDVEPRFRRIELSCSADWVRILFRRKSPILSTQDDMIFLGSRLALMVGMQAVKHYIDRDPGSGNAMEANAIRMLSNDLVSTAPPIGSPMQFDAATMLGQDFLE